MAYRYMFNFLISCLLAIASATHCISQDITLSIHYSISLSDLLSHLMSLITHDLLAAMQAAQAPVF